MRSAANLPRPPTGASDASMLATLRSVFTQQPPVDRAWTREALYSLGWPSALVKQAYNEVTGASSPASSPTPGTSRTRLWVSLGLVALAGGGGVAVWALRRRRA